METHVKFWQSLAGMMVAGTIFLAGCKPDAALRKGETIERDPVKTAAANPSQAVSESAMNNAGISADVTQFGNVQGVVTFAGDVPKPVKIDMSMDPACAVSGGTNMSEQLVVTGGRLENVYVYVKNGVTPSQAPNGQPPVVLDQQGCRYVPHVIAVQQGGSVEFKNSDPTMHNVHTMPTVAANGGMDVSEGPMGQPQVRQFPAAEVMMPVRCNNHPWMSAFINVSETPYFAVTGGDGKFSIRGLPPGTYTLAAVQEKLGEQDMQVTVPAKGTAKAMFKFGAR
jgi:plastocyanin